MITQQELLSSGAVAERFGIHRAKLIYLLERREIPEPAIKVAGRRLFSQGEAERIGEILARLPASKK